VTATIAPAPSGAGTAYGEPIAWRDHAGAWHWDPEHVRRVLVLRALDPAPPRAVTASTAGEVGPPPATSSPPTAAEVRRVALAMAAAQGWDELRSLAQLIWLCPVHEPVTLGRYGAPLPTARARLCAAYTHAVDRLWGGRCLPLAPAPRRGRPRAVAA
jgi:hypothetical protein